MSKPSWFFWIVAVFAFLWGVFNLFDFVMTYTGNTTYLSEFPPEMIAWIQGFPLWRVLLWAVAVFASFLGATFLLMRKGIASLILWAGAIAMIVGFFGYDIAMANGVEMYGAMGLAVSSMIVVVSLFLAWYAGRAKRQGYLS